VNDPASASTERSFQTGYLARPMELPGLLVFGLFFVALSIAAMQFLIGVWPGHQGPVVLFWGLVSLDIDATADGRLALVAILSGALGAFVHAATSFAVYLGNRQLIRSWAAWYALRPFIGMALALLFYFLIRAGFVVASATADQSAINPYGIAAIGGLAGMFSKQATDKLEDVFNNLLKPPEKAERLRGEPLRPE
jgi:hypothetical protein